jgi:pimeloyl-ACP methyl ester carboxylesterase
MHEQAVIFEAGDISLAGNLALPDTTEPYPAVLLIPGSGQTDRDDNTKKFKINVLHDISHSLAERGIASLRYDKRGIGESGGDYWSTGFNERTEDARTALHYLQGLDNVQPNNVFVLGHSEGSLISVRLAASEPKVAGAILIAGAAHSGEDVLKWQALEVAKGLKGFNGWLVNTFHIDVAKKQQKAFDKINSSNKDVIRQQLIVKLNAKWFREFMAYDPTEDLSSLRVPVCAITGSKDIQVDPKDLEVMASLVKGPFEPHLIENMTHLLRIEHGESSVSNYKKLDKQPVEPQLLEIVYSWVKKQVKPSST